MRELPLVFRDRHDHGGGLLSALNGLTLWLLITRSGRRSWGVHPDRVRRAFRGAAQEWSPQPALTARGSCWPLDPLGHWCAAAEGPRRVRRFDSVTLRLDARRNRRGWGDNALVHCASTIFSPETFSCEGWVRRSGLTVRWDIRWTDLRDRSLPQVVRAIALLVDRLEPGPAP